MATNCANTENIDFVTTTDHPAGAQAACDLVNQATSKLQCLQSQQRIPSQALSLLDTVPISSYRDLQIPRTIQLSYSSAAFADEASTTKNNQRSLNTVETNADGARVDTPLTSQSIGGSSENNVHTSQPLSTPDINRDDQENPSIRILSAEDYRAALVRSIGVVLSRYYKHSDFKADIPLISELRKDPSMLSRFLKIAYLASLRQEVFKNYRSWDAELERSRNIRDDLIYKKEKWLVNYRVGGIGTLSVNLVEGAKKIELENQVSIAHDNFNKGANAVENLLMLCHEHVVHELKTRPYLDHVLEILDLLSQSPKFGGNLYTVEVMITLDENLNESLSVHSVLVRDIPRKLECMRNGLRSLTQVVLSMPRK